MERKERKDQPPPAPRLTRRPTPRPTRRPTPRPTSRPRPRYAPKPYKSANKKYTDQRFCKMWNQTCQRKMFLGIVPQDNCCEGHYICDEKTLKCRSFRCGNEGQDCERSATNDGCCNKGLECQTFGGLGSRRKTCVRAGDIESLNEVLITKEDQAQAVNQDKDFEDEPAPSVNEIAKECRSKVYDVTLYAFEGPHFAIAVTLPKDEIDTKKVCPSAVGVFSEDGERKYEIAYPNHKNEELVPRDEIKLGSAQLDDFLKATGDVKPIADSDYDFTTNSCVHFAQGIWRGVGVAETTELAEFIINNVVNDNGLKELLEEYGDTGSFRTTAMLAIGGKAATRRFISDVVYEQLVISQVDSFGFQYVTSI